MTDASARSTKPVARPAPGRRPVGRAERCALIAIMVTFACVVALWAVLTPMHGVPDETAHLNSGIRLATEGSWPDPGEARVLPMAEGALQERLLPHDDRSTFAELAETADVTGDIVDQMSQHPPLYYAIEAVLLLAIDFTGMRWDLGMLAVRGLGIAMALAMPLLAWAATRRATGSARAAIVAAAALLLVPQLAQNLASISNDGLTILLASTTIWLAVRVLTGDRSWWTSTGIALSLGLALLTKGTALPLIPFVALVLVVSPDAMSVGKRILRMAVVLVGAFAVGGWWWMRNLVRFGDLQPSGLAGVRQPDPWEPGTGPDPIWFLDELWSRMSGSFWGDFGWSKYPLPELVTDALSVVAIGVIAVYGFRSAERKVATLMALLPVLFIVMLIANTWRHYVRTQLPAGMQGRYLFVVIVALLVLSAIAWLRFVPAHRRRLVATSVLVVAAFVAALGLLREYIGVFEGDQYRITAQGLAELAARSPVGAPGIAAMTIVLVVVTAVAAVFTVGCLRPAQHGGAASAGGDVALGTEAAQGRGTLGRLS